MRKILISVLLLIVQPLWALDLTIEQKMDDLHQAISMIKAGYGPLEYKQNRLNFTIDDLYQKYIEKVKATKSNAEFYYTINQLIAEFHDGHFTALLPTDYKSTLGFNTDLVDGKIILYSIDRNILSKEKFPYKPGDELVSIDGISAANLIKKFSKYRGRGSELSEKRHAAYFASIRRGDVVPVATGKAIVEIKPRHDQQNIKKIELEWHTSGTPFDEADFHKQSLTENQIPTNDERLNLSIDHSWQKSDISSDEPMACEGTTRINIPDDATLIMKEPFTAYYHPHPTDKHLKIGYLRLPHFKPQREGGGEEQFEIRLNQYMRAIYELEQQTDGLIIDTNHNCGGNIIYFENLLSLFMDKDFLPLQFELRATKADYLNFAEWLKEIPEYTLHYDLIKYNRDLIKETYLKGDFLTSKTSLSVPGLLSPNGIRYTKPIIILIDELAASGGDAFPTLMQGYGRAKLLGTQTMGAGGHVNRQPDLYNSGIKIFMTKSLFYRPDGQPVENHGAIPDYPYTITVNDSVNGFVDYQAFYLEKIKELIHDQQINSAQYTK